MVNRNTHERKEDEEDPEQKIVQTCSSQQVWGETQEGFQKH